MASLGYDPNNLTINTDTPAGIGNVACAAVLAFRHGDGSNQLGDLHPGPYSDWTGYVSVNPASTVPVNPRSEEHTSELQSHLNLVCRLLLEKKKTYTYN